MAVSLGLSLCLCVSGLCVSVSVSLPVSLLVSADNQLGGTAGEALAKVLPSTNLTNLNLSCECGGSGVVCWCCVGVGGVCCCSVVFLLL